MAYALTMAPSITWEHGGVDSGEVTAAAAVLGVAHPPGYALFVALGHAFVRGLPWLEPARATNVMSVLLCAAAAWLAYRAALEATGRPLAALTAAWALALGPLWWRIATFTTPHAMNLLLAGATCLLVGRALRRGLGRGESFAAGVLVGLAMTHHPTLLALPAAWLVGALTVSGGGAGVVARRALLGLGLGLTPWAALPLLAAADPSQLWGEPWHAAGLAEHVLGGEYAEYLGSASIGEHALRLVAGAQAVAAELGPIGVPLALLGVALAWNQARPYVVFLAALTLTLLGFYAAYPARDVDGYLLPACAAAAPVIASGAAALARGRAASVGLVAVTAGVGLALSWAALDLSRDQAAIAFARSTLAVAPPGAVLQSDTDRHTFALWYGQRAFGLRPDVVVVDRSMLSLGWYRRQLERRHGDLTGRPVYVVKS